MSRIAAAVTAGIGAAALTLSACGGSTPTAAPSSASAFMTSSVTAGPGSPSTMASARSSATVPAMSSGMPMTSPGAPSGPHDRADITFAQQMTIHHRGAIAMADLAPARAASSQVKSVAATIRAAQAPEIAEMTGWLALWAPGTDTGGMSGVAASSAMGGMPRAGSSTAAMSGMMSDQQMAALTAASGAAFDKMFVQLMITHHQGALVMASTEQAQGSNPAAVQLAAQIINSQTAQIAQLQSMLKIL